MEQMAKTKTPFLSLGAKGTVGRSITAQESHGSTILRGKPLPTDPRSLPQVYQRWLYEDYAYLWRQQTEATKATYRAAGVRFHLTGFQYWMKYQLTNLPDIVAMWRMDDNRGATTLDSSRNSNHLSIVGASPATLRIDGALSLDGLNDYIYRGPDAFAALPALFTLDLFVRFTAHGVWRTLWIVWLNGANYFTLRTSPAGALRTLLYKGGAVQIDYSSPALNTTDIYHICLTSDLTNQLAVTYINGSPVGTDTSFAYPAWVTPYWNFGLFPAVGYWGNFIIDQATYYNRILDVPTILRHSQRRYPLQ